MHSAKFNPRARDFCPSFGNGGLAGTPTVTDRIPPLPKPSIPELTTLRGIEVASQSESHSEPHPQPHFPWPPVGSNPPPPYLPPPPVILPALPVLHGAPTCPVAGRHFLSSVPAQRSTIPPPPGLGCALPCYAGAYGRPGLAASNEQAPAGIPANFGSVAANNHERTSMSVPKPKVPDTLGQLAYEEQIERRKAADPAYALECKERQLRRYKKSRMLGRLGEVPVSSKTTTM